jgi:hypothetical protein
MALMQAAPMNADKKNPRKFISPKADQRLKIRFISVP